MTFHDCLAEAARAAIDSDVPAWLLHATIVNNATLLGGAKLDGEDVMSRA